jgi:hypothetical protein
MCLSQLTDWLSRAEWLHHPEVGLSYRRWAFSTLTFEEPTCKHPKLALSISAAVNLDIWATNTPHHRLNGPQQGHHLFPCTPTDFVAPVLLPRYSPNYSVTHPASNEVAHPSPRNSFACPPLKTNAYSLQVALSRSIWAHQIGQPGLLPAQKLTDLYRTPRTST